MRLLFWFSLFALFQPAIFAQDYFARAVVKFEAGEYENAQLLFQKQLQNHPDHLKSQEYLGDIEAHQQNWEAAISVYKKLMGKTPDNADLHYKYGGAMGMKASGDYWFALLNYKEIRHQFEEAIRLNPSHIDAHWALVEYYLQLLSILGGGEEKATRFANRLLEISQVDGYLALGRIAEFYKKDSEAEKAYLHANQVGQSIHTYRTLGDFYAKRGQKEKALTVFRKANEKFQNEFSEDLERLKKDS